MKKIPLLVSLTVVLAMALVQWRFSWPPAQWEESNILGHAAKFAIACPVEACQAVIHNLIAR